MDPAIEEADQEVQQEEVEQTDGEAERGSDSGEKAGQILSKHKNSKDGSKTFWECIHRYDGCKKRLHTLAGTFGCGQEIGEHKHRVDPKAIPLSQFKNRIKQRRLRPWRIRRRYSTRNSSENLKLCKGWWSKCLEKDGAAKEKESGTQSRCYI
uniref:Uncharacterized protein n=1 Tax=Ditylenchus dipsaci TaxID=166011 RepID=A0A915DDI5_9BILA